MIERPSTDKVRFIADGITDPRAVEPPWVHAVEISDYRSDAYFVTVWVRGKCPLARETIASLAAMRPDIENHDPGVFHRDGEHASWIKEPGFTQHYHWTFDHQPAASDVTAVLAQLGDGVSAEMKYEVRSYYDERQAA